MPRTFQRIKNLWFCLGNNWSEFDVFIIVSTGRTGTQFLADFFNHFFPEIYAVHEPSPDFFNLSRNKYRYNWSSCKIRWKLQSGRRYQYEQLKNRSLHHYMECNNQLSPILSEVIRVFNPKIVHITRNLKDYLESAFRKKLGNDAFFYGVNDIRSRLTANDFPNDKFHGRWQDFSREARICWHWTKFNELILQATSNYPHYLQIKFEDIFDSQSNSRSLLKMINFFGLTHKHLYSDFNTYLSNTKVNSSSNDGIYRASSWLNDNKVLIDEMCGDLLKQFGYF